MPPETPATGRRPVRGQWDSSLEHRSPIYIGDEASAAGFRLAGVTGYFPSDEQLAATFRRALRETDLLLIEVNYARRLPVQELREAIEALSPLVLIVPDLLGRTPMRDLDQRLYAELGVRL